jgi:hypothetical protein
MLCMDKYLDFLSPVDGDVLNEFDGEIKDDKGHRVLEIKVKVAAPAGSNIRINGVSTRIVDEQEISGCCTCRSCNDNRVLYEATITLDGYRNTITARDDNSGNESKAVVYWLREGTGKYRISADDNIWFLRDLTKNSNIYKSLFDNPYLKVYKDVHDKYGTKFHFNLFYQTEGFNLSQMTDKYKSEWQANADWIRLTFHALQEFPDKPYETATCEKMKEDYLLVTNEIVRFAGEELLSPITTTHWGTATLQGARTLRSLGVKGLVGYFVYDEEGKPLASYYTDNKVIDHLNKRDCWKDNAEDIMFVKHDIVLNTLKLKDVVPYLENVKKDPHQSGIMEMLIHEQYFYDYYHAYIPEFKEILMTAARWATENGYKPTFLSEVVLEK